MTPPPNSSLSHAGGGTLKPSDVLAKAADLIEPPGKWLNAGGWSDGDEPYAPNASCWCALGGCVAVVGSWRVWTSDWGHYLARAIGCPTADIPEWNDAPERTQAEVVAALRKASDLARSQGQ